MGIEAVVGGDVQKPVIDQKPISFALSFAASAIFGSLVILENVLELLLAFLGTSMITKLPKLSDNICNRTVKRSI